MLISKVNIVPPPRTMISYIQLWHGLSSPTRAGEDQKYEYCNEQKELSAKNVAEFREDNEHT